MNEFLFSVIFCRCLEPDRGRGSGSCRARRTPCRQKRRRGGAAGAARPQGAAAPGGFPPWLSTSPGPLRGPPAGGRQQAGRSPPVSLGRALRAQRRCWGDLCPQLRGVRRRAVVLSTSTTTSACPDGWLSKSAPVANGTVRVSSHTVGV